MADTRQVLTWNTTFGSRQDKAINILRYYKCSQVMLLIHDELYGIVGLTEMIFDGYSELFYNECALTCSFPQDGLNRLWGASDFPVKM